MRKTGNPRHYYKQGALFESTDGGHTFRLVSGGMTEHYGHRGTILWTQGNVVVITHQGGVPGKNEHDGQVYARISLDGGKRWLDGTEAGTPLMGQSKKFLLVPRPPGHSFTAPTLEVSDNHFLTVYFHGDLSKNIALVSGVLWHLENLSCSSSDES
jgi:hypothetical protein